MTTRTRRFNAFVLAILCAWTGAGFATTAERGAPMAALDSPPWATACDAWDINPSGAVIVGFCASGATTLPVQWTHGQPETLDGAVHVTDDDGMVVESTLLFGIAAGINAYGQVAGQIVSVDAGNNMYVVAGRWDPVRRIWEALPATGGGLGGHARGINNHGAVVGAVSSHAAVWNAGEITLMDEPPNSVFCRGFAINNSRESTGSCIVPDGGDFNEVALLWNADGTIKATLGEAMSDLSPTFGRAINQAGSVAGAVGGNATRWRSPEFQADTLATPGAANGINDRGDAVGYLGINGGVGADAPRGVLWRAQSTSAEDLGTLGGDRTFPRAINNKGMIVGTAPDAGDVFRAFVVWPD